MSTTFLYEKDVVLIRSVVVNFICRWQLFRRYQQQLFVVVLERSVVGNFSVGKKKYLGYYKSSCFCITIPLTSLTIPTAAASIRSKANALSIDPQRSSAADGIDGMLKIDAILLLLSILPIACCLQRNGRRNNQSMKVLPSCVCIMLLLCSLSSSDMFELWLYWYWYCTAEYDI